MRVRPTAVTGTNSHGTSVGRKQWPFRSESNGFFRPSFFFVFCFHEKKMAATGAGKQITRRVFIFVDYCFFFFFFGRVSFHSTVDGLTVFFFCFRFVRSFCVISLSLSRYFVPMLSHCTAAGLRISSCRRVDSLLLLLFLFQVLSFFFSILGLLFAVIVLVGWIASDCRPSEGGET